MHSFDLYILHTHNISSPFHLQHIILLSDGRLTNHPSTPPCIPSHVYPCNSMHCHKNKNMPGCTFGWSIFNHNNQLLPCPQSLFMRFLVFIHLFVWARMVQSVKRKPRLAIYRSQGSSLIALAVFFWYGALANFLLQIASVASEQHGKNNGSLNQWTIRVKITSR